MSKSYVWSTPQTFAQCHASTLVELANGDLLCAFFAGTREGARDVGIYWSRCRSGRWGDVTLAAKVAPVAHWNPVLFRDFDEKVFLFFKVGLSPKVWKTFAARSLDGGASWGDPEELVPGDASGGRGPVKNKPIQLADGTILAPASKEGEDAGAFVDRSTDGGHSWQRSDYVPPTRTALDPSAQINVSVIQPTLWESAPGVVHMLLRSNAGRIYRSDSADCGRSWCAMYPTALEHNNSGIDLVGLPNGLLVLAHNPTGYWRNKLLLSISRDNGGTWEALRVLEDEPENVPANEYSYPAIILRNDGRLAISYTYKRRNIAVVQATFDELANRQSSVQ